MKEEQVTKALLKWLIKLGWEIICFDFPQSGTGKVLHPNNTTSKTDGAIIPDIIAYKDHVVVDFENKDRFVLDDFNKVFFLKNTAIYDRSLKTLLRDHPYDIIYYGVGMPYTESNSLKAEENSNLVDFIVFVTENMDVKISPKGKNIF